MSFITEVSFTNVVQVAILLLNKSREYSGEGTRKSGKWSKGSNSFSINDNIASWVMVRSQQVKLLRNMSQKKFDIRSTSKENIRLSDDFSFYKVK